MDGSTAIKRRRPHTFDDEGSPQLYGQSVNAAASYTSQQQCTLQEAADILQIPLAELYGLSPRFYNAYIIQQAAFMLGTTPQALLESTSPIPVHAQQKRLRLSIGLAEADMSLRCARAPLDRCAEKEDRPGFSGALNSDRNNRPPVSSHFSANSQFFLGAAASGVANCLASLTSCGPSPPHVLNWDYASVSTTSAGPATLAQDTSRYTDATPYMLAGPVAAGAAAAAETPETPETPVAATASSAVSNEASFDEVFRNGYTAPPTQNWLADNSTDMSQHNMPSYPALQPNTTPSQLSISSVPYVAQVQPSTHSESMCYPSVSDSSSLAEPNQALSTEPAELLATMPMMPFDGPEASSTLVQSRDGLVDMSTGTAPNSSPLQFDRAPAPIVLPNFVPLAATVPVSAAATFATTKTENVSSPVFLPDAGQQPGLAVLSPDGAPRYEQAHYESTPYEPPRHNHGVPMAQNWGQIQDHMLMPSYVDANSMAIPIQPYTRPPAARRGPFKVQADRLKTAQTRKDGSCIRCRMQRIRCNADEGNPKGECRGCKKSNGRTWRLPCLRLKIGDVVVAKTGQVKGYEWTERWKENTILNDVGQWASSEIRVVRITEGYTNQYVELRVRKFVPQEGDSLERSWVTPDGQVRSVKIPPYAVVDSDSIAREYSAYIKRGLAACVKNVLSDQKNTLIFPTYWFAARLVYDAEGLGVMLSEEERSLLSVTLELWMSVRLTTRSFEIVGDETLDMPRDILDETNPSHGKIPIPPVMGAQLDSVLIHEIQRKLRRQALDGLHKLVTENKTRTWLTTYLVMFMLLHNAALVIKHDASYARKHGIPRRFAREDKVQQYHTGAITLLAYFHYCNKGVFPFTEDAREQDIRNLANLDERAMRLVRGTRGFAIANKQRWQRLLEEDAYEDDYYYICQLFEAKWHPRSMKI